jgi:lipopolysaccharide/colanic/teichoic acid biosynthesis glycosyltransferase
LTVKRIFDIFFSILALLILGWVLIIGYIIVSIDTNSNGLYLQKRVGQFGVLFSIFKLKTIHPKTGNISKIGFFFRKYKIDEFPQLLNVLLGNMSFVGPRPDIEGYYDKLEGENRRILELKPGITSLASIKYFNEEELLSKQENPLVYNDTIIFPDKVKMNLEYYYDYNFWKDISIIMKTIYR